VEEGEAFEADDAPLFRSPPPQDDRLWRHPSEIGWQSTGGQRGRSWPLAGVSALAGAVLAIGVLAATGTINDDRPLIVHEVVGSMPDALNGVSGAEVTRIGNSVAPSIVRLEISGGSQPVASAVVFRDDGYAITDAHAISGASGIVGALSNGSRLESTVVGVDAATDLAVVKLAGSGPFRTAVLGTTDGLAEGEVTLSIGAPLRSSGPPTVTSGVVSAFGRDVTGPNGTTLKDVIQTDAPVGANATGGALVDDQGNVIGITMVHSGWRCATPVDVARTVAEELVAVGHVRTVWLGIRGTSAKDGTGVVVAALLDNAPASNAGLRDGDVIRRVDGRPVTSMTSLRMVLRRRHPDERVTVVYERAGKRRSAAVSLTERPA
jgi:S1-C subfamily serine protease